MGSSFQERAKVSLGDRFAMKTRGLRYRVDWFSVVILTVIGLSAFGMLILLITIRESRVIP